MLQRLRIQLRVDVFALGRSAQLPKTKRFCGSQPVSPGSIGTDAGQNTAEEMYYRARRVYPRIPSRYAIRH
jgi:hypothetical protein